MNLRNLAVLERSVPARAVKALAAAHRRALAVGSVLVVEDAALVELFGDGRRVVIQALPPRVKVGARVKHATS